MPKSVWSRTSAIKIDGGLQGDYNRRIVGGLQLLQSLVVVGDVSLMVLLVVQLHDVAADVGLQRPVVVVQVGQPLSVERGRGQGPPWLRPPHHRGHRLSPHSHHRRRHCDCDCRINLRLSQQQRCQQNLTQMATNCNPTSNKLQREDRRIRRNTARKRFN